MKRGLLIMLILSSFCATAQQGELQGQFNQARLKEVLNSIQEQSGHQIYYETSWLDSLFFTGSIKGQSTDSALSKVLKQAELNYFWFEEAYYLTKDTKIIGEPAILRSIQKRDSTTSQEVELGFLFTQEYITPIGNKQDDALVVIGDRKNIVAGSKSAIAGYIQDAETKDPLQGVVIYSQDRAVATTTDANGFYSISLPNGRHTLLFQFVGMKTAKRDMVLFSDGQLNAEMYVDVIALQEVMIESESDANVQNVLIGVNKLDVEETKNVPLVLGESDIMKIATTFAGVQTVGEGGSGFNVRGGKSDQNLVLLNGATIYNASHFFGFFSIFNSSTIQDMKIYKSGIPANFGGRLSSVFDIESKQANLEEFVGEGGISPISAKLNLEVPIVEKKSSLMIGGRTTFSNWLLKKVGNADFSENEVFFADGILRYDHEVNENNELLVSAYYSRDNFRLSSDTIFSFSNFSYTNGNASVRWNHRFSNQFEGHLSAVYSSYNYKLSYDESPPNNFYQDFRINESSLNSGLAYHIDDKHTFQVGVEMKKYNINPGTKGPMNSESIVADQKVDSESAVETNVYLSDEWVLSEKLTVYGGYRYTFFTNLGSQTVYEYEPGFPKNGNTLIDSVYYDDGEPVQTYHGGEVRLSARFVLGDQSSIKASYNRTRQYIHTLSNTSSLSPTDTWRLSNPHIKPQVADQYTLGFYRNFKENMIEFSVESYYKKMDNLLDFKIGSQFLLNRNIEQMSLQGPGKSYGVEVSLRKSGRLNGWVNYSYARSLIQLDSRHPEEIVNNGNFYPTNFDKPHTLNLVGNFKITKRWSCSANFTYNTGRPVTYPVGAYEFKGSEVVHYSDRNLYRIPDYIRLDIGINLEASHKLAKLAHSYWSFSVYNVLGRDNPFSVFFDIRNGKVSGYQLVVFPTPIPTISYNFRF